MTCQRCALACEGCGLPRDPHPPHSGRGRRYCSRPCQDRSRRRVNPQARCERCAVACEGCGCPLDQHPPHMGNARRFCSGSCRQRVWKAKRKPKRRCKCPWCGASFTTPKSNKRFCRVSCRQRYQRRAYRHRFLTDSRVRERAAFYRERERLTRTPEAREARRVALLRYRAQPADQKRVRAHNQRPEVKRQQRRTYWARTYGATVAREFEDLLFERLRLIRLSKKSING